MIMLIKSMILSTQLSWDQQSDKNISNSTDARAHSNELRIKVIILVIMVIIMMINIVINLMIIMMIIIMIFMMIIMIVEMTIRWLMMMIIMMLINGAMQGSTPTSAAFFCILFPTGGSSPCIVVQRVDGCLVADQQEPLGEDS